MRVSVEPTGDHAAASVPLEKNRRKYFACLPAARAGEVLSSERNGAATAAAPVHFAKSLRLIVRMISTPFRRRRRFGTMGLQAPYAARGRATTRSVWAPC